MRTDLALARLHEHQQQVLAHLERALALVDGEPESVRVPLAKSRWELIRLLREYQVFKHREIFEPAIALGSREQRAVAERMKEACLAIAKTLEAHARHWSGADIVADWADYKPAMQAMVARLRSHIDGERRAVAGLLAGAERTRKLAAAAPPAGRAATDRRLPPQ